MIHSLIYLAQTYASGYNMTYIVIFLGISVLSYMVQASLKSKFEKFSKIPTAMTGRDIAIKMLHDNGIYDVKVTSTPGMLTDHYNPADKTVNLSQGVYNSASIAAAAVVSFSSSIMMWILLIGVITVETFPQLLLAGIVLFATTTIFSFITLPVEIDASRRALVWLQGAGVTNVSNHKYAFSALRSAAYTYVIAAISSLATLLYYVMIYLNRRD